MAARPRLLPNNSPPHETSAERDYLQFWKRLPGTLSSTILATAPAGLVPATEFSVSP